MFSFLNDRKNFVGTKKKKKKKKKKTHTKNKTKKNWFDLAKVNEPSVFEPLRFNCN